MLRRFFLLTLALATGVSFPAWAQNSALLLYDGEKGKEFVGCLNCSKFESSSICNQFGTYGSKFNSDSIWNQFGTYGSRFNTNSPWNKFGEGLRIVDEAGKYYGRFTTGYKDKSSLKIVRAIVSFYEINDDLDDLRNALCE